jgi:hypothetical protein
MNLELTSPSINNNSGILKKSIRTVSGKSENQTANPTDQGANSRGYNPFHHSITTSRNLDTDSDPAVRQLEMEKLLGEQNRSQAQTQTKIDHIPEIKLTNKSFKDLNEKQDGKPKTKIEELKELLKEQGFTDKDIKLLEPFLENRDFQRLIENDPGQAREMLETIKSDPFNNLTGKKPEFKKDNYDVFSKQESTSIESTIKAALGDGLFGSLDNFAKQNNFNSKLYGNLLEQVLANPEIKNLLSDESLSGREKLQKLQTMTADFVKNGMVEFGAIEVDGKLRTSGANIDEAKVFVFGDAEAKSKFYEKGGQYDQAKEQNPHFKFAFIELDGNKNSLELAKSLGIDGDKISKGEFNAALISAKGYDPSNPGELLLKGDNFLNSLSDLNKALKESSKDGWGNPLSKDLTKDLDALANGQAKSLNIDSSDSKDNNKFADLYANTILKQITNGENHSLSEGLNLGSGSLADIASNAVSKFDKAEKSGLKLDSNNLTDVLGKFSGLESNQISQLKQDLGGSGIDLNARSTAVLLQGGKTDAKDITANDKLVMSMFDKYQGIAGRNTESLYNSDMKELHSKGVLVDYLYDKMPGSSMTYREAAESIMNIPKDTKGFFDGATGLNAIGSVNTIAQILKDPENAFKDGNGFYARLTIADAKDHNGAFGLNSGNHYVRGNEEAAMSLLSGSKIGNITIYAGNGMTDDEFTKRIQRLINTDTKIDGDRGQLAALSENSSVRGLGLKHVSEEGHGNPNGNHGVSGSMDSGDKDRFQIYSSLVKGDSFSLNCVACSNLRGENSYGHAVLNGMAEHLAKNVRLYATGAEIDTPPGKDRVTHFKGHIAPGLMTNSDRLIVMQGKQEVNDADLIQLSNAYLDKYNITRNGGNVEADVPEKKQSLFLDTKDERVSVSSHRDSNTDSKTEWLAKTTSKET